MTTTAAEAEERAYGFGAGVFLLGYFPFEVPSNLALHRVGARLQDYGLRTNQSSQHGG